MLLFTSVWAWESANTSTSSRSATITFKNSCGATKTVSVTQAGKPNCTLSVSQTSASFGSSMLIGGEANITVTSSTGEFFTSKSDTWILITGESSSGFKIGVGINMSSSSRSGTVTVSNSCGESKTINVTQSGQTATTGNINIWTTTGYGSSVSFSIDVGYSTSSGLTPTSGWIGIIAKDGEMTQLTGVKAGTYTLMANGSSISGQCPDSINWAAGGTASFSPSTVTVEAGKDSRVTLTVNPAGC